MFLRGWGEYQPYGLKLTEAPLPGIGHVAWRAWDEPGLERRVAAIEAARVSARRLDRGRSRARPRLPASATPTGT